MSLDTFVEGVFPDCFYGNVSGIPLSGGLDFYTISCGHRKVRAVERVPLLDPVCRFVKSAIDVDWLGQFFFDDGAVLNPGCVLEDLLFCAIKEYIIKCNAVSSVLAGHVVLPFIPSGLLVISGIAAPEVDTVEHPVHPEASRLMEIHTGISPIVEQHPGHAAHGRGLTHA